MDVFQVFRAVPALDDLCHAVVPAQFTNDFRVVRPVALGEEDVACPFEMPGRLTQRAPREQEPIAEGEVRSINTMSSRCLRRT